LINDRNPSGGEFRIARHRVILAIGGKKVGGIAGFAGVEAI